MNALLERRETFLNQWQDLVFGTYPPDSARLFRDGKDRFSNPVGSTISTALAALYDGLASGAPLSGLRPAIESIVKVRAVQDFSPSEAVGFTFQLKQVLREGGLGPSELEELDEKIDGIASMAFDIYVACREKLFEIKANELRRRTWKLLERAGLTGLGPEDASTEIKGLSKNTGRREPEAIRDAGQATTGFLAEGVAGTYVEARVPVGNEPGARNDPAEQTRGFRIGPKSPDER